MGGGRALQAVLLLWARMGGGVRHCPCYWGRMLGRTGDRVFPLPLSPPSRGWHARVVRSSTPNMFVTCVCAWMGWVVAWLLTNARSPSVCLPLPRVGTYDHLDADAGFEDADIHPEPGLSTSMPGQTVRPRV
jgi:hypothetical protein